MHWTDNGQRREVGLIRNLLSAALPRPCARKPNVPSAPTEAWWYGQIIVLPLQRLLEDGIRPTRATSRRSAEHRTAVVEAERPKDGTLRQCWCHLLAE